MDFPNPNSSQIFKEIAGKRREGVNAMIQGSAPETLAYKRFDKELHGFYKEDPGNAGYDLFARLDAPTLIFPGEAVVIPLNVAAEIPMGFVGLLFQRSSTYRKWKVKLTNGVGVIDASFSGDGDEWGAEVKNESSEPVTIHPGDKICQALFFKLADLVLLEKRKLEGTDRGGFGTSFDNANEKGENAQ
ncbi:dUTP diphosphatase (plasmid) [Paenibacillus sp. S-38]|uniref:dUTP diphosphatase n=1 Tax=Paenibacillus sp. S-38 TaxID=3416710 RepID=UPI003CE7BAD9